MTTLKPEPGFDWSLVLKRFATGLNLAKPIRFHGHFFNLCNL